MDKGRQDPDLANTAQMSGGNKGEESNMVMSHQQFQQLLKLIPGNQAFVTG